MEEGDDAKRSWTEVGPHRCLYSIRFAVANIVGIFTCLVGTMEMRLPMGPVGVNEGGIHVVRVFSMENVEVSLVSEGLIELHPSAEFEYF